jgi:hypothetical protein
MTENTKETERRALMVLIEAQHLIDHFEKKHEFKRSEIALALFGIATKELVLNFGHHLAGQIITDGLNQCFGGEIKNV